MSAELNRFGLVEKYAEDGMRGEMLAAMKKAGIAIVQIHMEECLNKTKNESVVKRGETLKDFQEAVSRYMDWA